MLKSIMFFRSDYGAMGANCTVLPDIDRVLNEFVNSKNPSGMLTNKWFYKVNFENHKW